MHMQEQFGTKTKPSSQEIIGEIFLEYRIQEDIIYHHGAEFARVFGLSAKIVHAQDYLIRSGVIQSESIKDFSELLRRIQNGEKHAECTVHARTAAGQALWMEIILTAVDDGEKVPSRAVGVLRDVTAKRERELEHINEAFHREIMTREALVYYEADLTAGRMLFGIESLFQSIGLKWTDNLHEITELLINRVIHPADREAVAALMDSDALLSCFAQGRQQVQVNYRRLTGEGTVIWVNGTAYLGQNPANSHVLLYFYVKDIGDQQLRELGSKDYAERDSLTGLYNKVAAEQYIRKAMLQGIEAGHIGAFLIINMRHFKVINETMGRYYGDALLSQLGNKLSNACHPGDIVARNGVEFLLYLPTVQGMEETVWTAKQIRALLDASDNQALKDCGLTTTVGIALSPEHGATYSELYCHACQALAFGKNADSSISVYHEGLRELSVIPQMSEPSHTDKMFSEHITEYIFRILYESKDSNTAIQNVLQLVMDHYGFKRCFLYDVLTDGTAECVFDCKTAEAEPFPAHLRTLEANQVSQVLQCFGTDNMRLYYSAEIPTEKRLPPDLNLRILCKFQKNDKFVGFVCFDYCKETGAEALLKESSSLLNVVQLLDVFQAGRAASKELWASHFLLQNIVDGMRNYTYIIDPITHLLKYVNQNTRQGLAEITPGSRCYQALRGRECPCEDCPIDRMLRDNTSEDQCEMYLDRYGMWAQIHSTLMRLPDGQVFGVFSGFDFSDQPKSGSFQVKDVRSFANDSSLYDALSLSTDDYIIMCDMSTMLFYFPKQMVEEFELPGQVIKDAIPLWTERVHPDDRADFEQDISRMLKGGTDSHSQEYRARNKNGIWTWLRARGHVERNQNGQPTLFAVVLTNLGRKSKIDQLTGIPDKYEFEVRTRALLTEDLPRGILLILGLDNFRHINSLYGWEFGDNVLREAALRLQATLPERVQLYRLDGDKFSVFFPNAPISEVKDYYHSLFFAFHQHRQSGEHRYFCTISGGCATFEGESPGFSALFKQASCALEHSKREGKNRLTIYNADTMNGSDRLLGLLAQLHESVERGCIGFELYFQPQIQPKTMLVTSAEALLRFRCCKYGMVSPVEFIPLLEQAGLIHEVGRWILRQASLIARQWRKYIPDFTISVNLSFAQLQEQAFLPYLQRKVQNGSIDPHALHLEITESCIANGSTSLKEVFEILRSMGFHMEMDDFGTGYSSLEILKNAPADVVKIDQAFVRDITKSNFDATFIQFVVSLCHSVGIRVCLEGVETQEEYNLVSAMDLDLIQGYHIDHPTTKENFEAKYILSK